MPSPLRLLSLAVPAAAIARAAKAKNNGDPAL
jgi:hypothetical protein